MDYVPIACSASCTTTLLREDTDLFLNVDATKEVSMGSYNNTPGGGKVMRLSSDYKTGPAFVLRLKNPVLHGYCFGFGVNSEPMLIFFFWGLVHGAGVTAHCVPA